MGSGHAHSLRGFQQLLCLHISALPAGGARGGGTLEGRSCASDMLSLGIVLNKIMECEISMARNCPGCATVSMTRCWNRTRVPSSEMEPPLRRCS